MLSLEIFCATMIALLFGMMLVFGGYRYFLLLLPIWGFFFGFGLGAQTMQWLLGEAFLGTVTGWMVGFAVGASFAVLSYLFFAVGVAMTAASLGYAIGVAIMAWIGVDFGFLTWLVGVVAGAALLIATIVYGLQKHVIVAATAIMGAALIAATFAVGVENVDMSAMLANPIATISSAHWFNAILFLALAVAGVVIQMRVNRDWVIEVQEQRW